jgi:hypothetical protein
MLGRRCRPLLLASTPPSSLCQALFDTLERVTTSPSSSTHRTGPTPNLLPAACILRCATALRLETAEADNKTSRPDRERLRLQPWPSRTSVTVSSAAAVSRLQSLKWELTDASSTGRSRDNIYDPVLADSEREAVADLLGFLENVPLPTASPTAAPHANMRSEPKPTSSPANPSAHSVLLYTRTTSIYNDRQA